MTYPHSPRSRGVRLAVLLPALAGSLFAYSAAMAQSTGSQEVEAVVVTAKRAANVDGLITLQEAPKTKSVITQAYISTQQPGQNVIQQLNQTPGLNFTNDDPYGMSGSGGHLRLRGFDGSRISLLVDGVPLNDTGNYAIYAGELVDPEIVSQVNVNVGSTDVDSPTASAVGGLININTLTPTDRPQGFVNGTVGAYNYRRVSGLIQTGEFGPLGTKAWFEASDQAYDKFKGFGTFKKWQINGKVYQPLWHDGDFVAVAFLYDSQRQPNIYGYNFATTSGPRRRRRTASAPTISAPISRPARPRARLGTTPRRPWCRRSASRPASSATSAAISTATRSTRPTPTTSAANPASPCCRTSTSPWTRRSSPSSPTAAARARTISESDPRLIGAATTFKCPTGQKGVDLNGDGDCLDTVRVFLPSLTHTERITVNTSLIWNINARQPDPPVLRLRSRPPPPDRRRRLPAQQRLPGQRVRRLRLHAGARRRRQPAAQP